jgi:hypothetical protein
MDVFRAIYSSEPFGYDSAILDGILMEARRANLRDGITGALICRADIYLQWLEGPELEVRKTLERIERDDRHLEVKIHVAEHVRRMGDVARSGGNMDLDAKRDCKRRPQANDATRNYGVLLTSSTHWGC